MHVHSYGLQFTVVRAMGFHLSVSDSTPQFNKKVYSFALMDWINPKIRKLKNVTIY